MPPPAAAAKNVFDGDGIPVTSDMRPIVFAGPMFRQRKSGDGEGVELEGLGGRRLGGRGR